MNFRSTLPLAPLLAGGLISLPGCRSGQPASDSKPLKYNIISILVDDWGWSDAGCLGSDLYETPNIDRLAAEGMRFARAYAACTVSSPTRAALMTGKYPARLHITDWISGHIEPHARMRVPDWTMYLPPEEFILPEALKQGDYHTIHIGKWHLGDSVIYHPQNQGFDINIAGYGKGQPPSYFFPYSNKTEPPIPYLEGGHEGEYLTDREAEEACNFIRENKDRPFYINLCHYAVHTPLQAKEEYIREFEGKVRENGRHRNPVYAAMIRSVDESLGRILTVLDETGIADRTAILITGDNGGLIGRGQRVTDNSPLRAGKGSPYEGGVRVPLLVKVPGITKPGSVCEEPVMTIDLYPTFVDLAGVPPVSGPDGLSLLPLLKDPEASLEREALYWHYPHYHPGGATPYSAILKGDYRLIEFLEDHRTELYDLKNDPGESQDLSISRPDLAKELLEDLSAWRAQVNAQFPLPNPDADLSRISPWLREIYQAQDSTAARQQELAGQAGKGS